MARLTLIGPQRRAGEELLNAVGSFVALTARAIFDPQRASRPHATFV